jgi:hypothetical protein
MTKIPKFEKFDEAIIPMGFGQTGISNFMLGGSTPEIDKAHESYSATNEAMVQVAGKDKPSGAKVLATVISDYLIDKNYISAINGRNPKGSREKKQLISEIQELIINSTF